VLIGRGRTLRFADFVGDSSPALLWVESIHIGDPVVDPIESADSIEVVCDYRRAVHGITRPTPLPFLGIIYILTQRACTERQSELEVDEPK
jgi:hypothetical protein